MSAVLTCLTGAHHGPAREPMYHRLADALESGVRDGAVAAGTALPSEVAIAGHLRVSRGTVRQALRLLERRRVVTGPSGANPRLRMVAPPSHLGETA